MGGMRPSVLSCRVLRGLRFCTAREPALLLFNPKSRRESPSRSAVALYAVISPMAPPSTVVMLRRDSIETPCRMLWGVRFCTVLEPAILLLNPKYRRESLSRSAVALFAAISPMALPSAVVVLRRYSIETPALAA